MTQAWAPIIAAMIGAIGAVIATNFGDVVSLLRKTSRIKVKGLWRGSQYNFKDTVESRLAGKEPSPENRQIVHLKQRGSKVKGTITMMREGKREHTNTLQGRVVDNYLLYECKADKSGRSSISTAMLYMPIGGNRLRGYFVAYSSKGDPWVGYVELEKISG